MKGIRINSYISYIARETSNRIPIVFPFRLAHYHVGSDQEIDSVSGAPKIHRSKQIITHCWGIDALHNDQEK